MDMRETQDQSFKVVRLEQIHPLLELDQSGTGDFTSEGNLSEYISQWIWVMTVR